MQFGFYILLFIGISTLIGAWLGTLNSNHKILPWGDDDCRPYNFFDSVFTGKSFLIISIIIIIYEYSVYKILFFNTFL